MNQAAFSATDYSHLMQRRVKKILLICSSYDAFILEEEGRFESQLTQEYLALNLSNPPAVERVSSAAEALERLQGDSGIDLIITVLNVGEIDPFHLGCIVKKGYPGIPVVLLSQVSRSISQKLEKEDLSGLDYVFYWMGNADLILSIIKLIEDRMNSENDILNVGVQSILLVEDSIRYYSTYLPVIYKLILQQSLELQKEALNEEQMMIRRRARPKILFARTYEEAARLYDKYHKNLLGVISDVSFKLNERSGETFEGGIALCRMIRGRDPFMPFILQSSRQEWRRKAEELNVGFLHKYSKTLLMELSEYINREFSFGDFVFKNPATGEVVARAGNLSKMQAALSEIPDDVLLYHTSQNHLSKWMFARGLFSLAAVLKEVRNTHFTGAQELRQFLIRSIRDYRIIVSQGVIVKFDAETYDRYIPFARTGEGSLGGKARGLAFTSTMLQKYKLYNKYGGVRISIPRTVVIATDYFDQFIRDNGLQYVINSDSDDNDILTEFIGSRLAEPLINDLRAYVKHLKGPVAVRSSSKLEDSYYQPFAGIYATYMIPYAENKDQMLRMLTKAIKSVYASVFYSASRSYILATSNVIAEEKMAVILQEICGTADSGYFFPTISGVARSVNFYPLENEKPEDGIVDMALGLGKLVVDGGMALRFSPRYPKKILQLSTLQLALRDTQREMYALSLKTEKFRTSTNDAVNLEKIDIQQAVHFRNTKIVASTWDMDNDRISDSFDERGRKIITFANILKYGKFPLTEIINELLNIGREEMNIEVEFEFAVNMDVPPEEEMVFNFLQIRPIVEEAQSSTIDWQTVRVGDAVIYSESALGLGRIRDISDLVYVKEEAFNPADTTKIAAQIDGINTLLKEGKKNYVLVGPGRWGSNDPWLGIPVKWGNISEARVIVECGMEHFRVDPSQGTHFFQNLTSFGVGYLTINPFLGDGFFNTDILCSEETAQETEFVRHIRLPQPLFIFIDGKANKGIIKKQTDRLEK